VHSTHKVYNALCKVGWGQDAIWGTGEHDLATRHARGGTIGAAAGENPGLFDRACHWVRCCVGKASGWLLAYGAAPSGTMLQTWNRTMADGPARCLPRAPVRLTQSLPVHFRVALQLRAQRVVMRSENGPGDCAWPWADDGPVRRRKSGGNSPISDESDVNANRRAGRVNDAAGDIGTCFVGNK